MLVIIKKWNLLLIAAIFLSVVVGAGFFLRQSSAFSTAAMPVYGKRIIVDAGHGSPDGGAVGSRQVLEKDLNLQIARFLQQYLEQSGADVIVTRSDDNGIYDADSRTIRQKKRTDLSNRETLMTDSKADFFVSIHMNHFSDSRYSGPQVFYSVNHAESKPLAEAVQKEMIAVLQPPLERAVKPAGKEIYLLNKAKLPAILVECGFLSNDREEQLLLDETYQKKTAWSIYCGLTKYLTAVC